MEVLNGLQHKVPDAKPYYDKSDKEYVPGKYDENSDDDYDDGGRRGDNDIQPTEEPADINNDDDATIILNPEGLEYDGLITGWTIYQYQNVVDTDKYGETEDTKPIGVIDLTGLEEPLGVTTPPTKEDSEQDYKEDANVTERCQKENDR